MWYGLPPVRLSTRPLGGQGQPYDDSVVKLARELAETTLLTRREIAARIGVSHMTITRWARSGGWIPLGWRRGSGFPARRWDALDRAALRPNAWGRLDEAERLLDALERQERASLDDIERALTTLLLARRDHGRPQRRGRKRRHSSNPPPASC